jgi:hypothetical protein
VAASNQVTPRSAVPSQAAGKFGSDLLIQIVCQWNGPAVLLPRQQVKLARGAENKEHAMFQKLNVAVVVIGIDIGKNSFHVVGLDQRGAMVPRQKWSRGQVETRLAIFRHP